MRKRGRNLETLATMMKMEMLKTLEEHPNIDRVLLCDAACSALKYAVEKKGYYIHAPRKNPPELRR